MKKFFTFFAAVLFAGSMMAEGLLFEQTYPGSPSAYTNNYTSSFSITTGDYALTYANFNNGKEADSWQAIRCGRKSEASLATITSAAIADNVSKVLVNFTQVNASKTNKLALLVADNAEFTDATEIAQTIAVGEIVFEIAAPAANMYYRISLDMQADGSYNGFNRIDKLQFISPDGGAPIVPTVYDTLNVAQAIDTASLLNDNATSGKFYIEGFAVNVAAYSTAYNNQDFFLVDDVAAPDSVLQVFRATPMKDGKAYPVLAGDQLRIFGALKKYVKDNKTQLEIVDSKIEFVKEAEGDRDIDVPETDTITIARALAIGDSIGQGNTTAGQYVIEGYVTALTDNSGNPTADGGWAQYGNQCMWVADTYDEAATTKDKAFFIYQGVAPEQVTKHAKIRVLCAIKNYNGMIETAVSRGAITILEKGDDPVAPADPDTITTAQAVEIAQALKEPEAGKSTTTADEYVVGGYAVKVWDRNSDKTWSFGMCDEEGGYYKFQASNATIKEGADTVVKNEYMYVRGRIAKRKTNSGTIQLQIYKGTAVHGVAPKIDTTYVSVAEALAVVDTLQENETAKAFFAVTGYAAKVYEAEDGVQSFRMSDDETAEAGDLYIKLAKIDLPVARHQQVCVYGRLTRMDGAVIVSGNAVNLSRQGIEQLVLTEKAQKVVVDGAVYIIRDNKLFNLQGAQVR